MQDDDNDALREHLWQLVDDVRFAMLTTHDPNGQLRSRPLTTQNKDRDHDSDLYFLIAASSTAADDVAADARVHVGYADPDKDRYVSISGHARTMRDPVLLARHWTPLAKAWFPGGLDDPDLCLLRVRMESAEYWDVKTSKMVQLLKMAKAAITGERAMDDHSEHRKVILSA